MRSRYLKPLFDNLLLTAAFVVSAAAAGESRWWNGATDATWPQSEAMVGGRWNDDACNFAIGTSAGVLLDGSSDTLTFEADDARALSEYTIRIDATMDFVPFGSPDEFPDPTEAGKAALVVCDGGYYGLARCGDTNGWLRLAGTVPGDGPVDVTITLSDSNAICHVAYRVNTIKLSANGVDQFEICSERDTVRAINCGGCGLIQAIAASATPAVPCSEQGFLLSDSEGFVTNANSTSEIVIPDGWLLDIRQTDGAATLGNGSRSVVFRPHYTPSVSGDHLRLDLNERAIANFSEIVHSANGTSFAVMLADSSPGLWYALVPSSGQTATAEPYQWQRGTGGPLRLSAAADGSCGLYREIATDRDPSTH